MGGAQVVQRTHLRLLGNLVEPVAMREAQKAFEAGPDGALEAPHAVGIAHVQALERVHQPVGEHQQRGLLEMGDEEEQEMLVPELRQHTAVAAAEERAVCIAHHHQRLAVAQVAGVRRSAAGGPETVVAEALLEVGEVLLGVGQGLRRVRRRARVARPGDQAQPDEFAARQCARIVQRQVGHQRHAVVLDLTVAQGARALGMVTHQGFKQERPMRGEARRAVFRHMGQEAASVLRVGFGQHPAVEAKPFHVAHAMQRAALRVPAGRVGAPEAVQHVLRLLQRQVGAGHLDVQQHQVDVEEEVQVDVDDVERQRFGLGR